MSSKSVDIATMLDDLNLPLSAMRWKEIVAAPELANFTPSQLFREVLEPQYLETMNNRYMTNLRLSKLIDKSALVENLVTGNKRRYNDAVVQQLLSFRFVEERLNVGVYGIKGTALNLHDYLKASAVREMVSSSSSSSVWASYRRMVTGSSPFRSSMPRRDTGLLWRPSRYMSLVKPFPSGP